VLKPPVHHGKTNQPSSISKRIKNGIDTVLEVSFRNPGHQMPQSTRNSFDVNDIQTPNTIIKKQIASRNQKLEPIPSNKVTKDKK
jgi:hypothetical protein